MTSVTMEEQARDVLKQYQGQIFLTALKRERLWHYPHKDNFDLDEISIEGIRLTLETQDIIGRIHSDREKALQVQSDRNVRSVMQALLIAGWEMGEMHPLVEVETIKKNDIDGTYSIRFRGVDLVKGLEKLGLEINKDRLEKPAEKEPDMTKVVKLKPPPRREPDPHGDNFEHAFLIPRGQGQSIV